MSRLVVALLLLLGVGSTQEVDPVLKAVVDRFFATQVAEDAEAYLALWSRTATRPQPQQLKYIFDSGDDKFLDLQIDRAVVSGDTARVRGSITRIRTPIDVKNPDGSPRMFSSRLQFALAFVREDGDWKLVREGSPIDELASALIATAEPSARAALLQSEPDLVTGRLLDAIGRQADNFARANQYKTALGIYQIGLDVALAMKDRKGEGQMLQNIANSLYFLRNFPGALTTYERRLALEREAANDEGIASALTGIATIRYATFEYSAALKLYLEALEIQERRDDLGLVATTLISTGNVRYLQGDFDAAIADYRRAEMLKRKYFDLGGASMALEGLGRTYVAQGDYGAAFVAFSTLLDDATKRKDVARQGAALYNMGDAHMRLANVDAARTSYDESRKAYETVKEPANAGRALHGIGTVELMAGRVAEAEKAYEKSREACLAADPDDTECIARALIGLGFAQASQERWDPAIESYRKGIDVLLQLNATEAAARSRVGLAEALNGKGEHVAALKETAEARGVGVAMGNDDLLWRALVSQSRAQRSLKRTDDALGAAKAAVVAVRQMAQNALRRPAFAIPRDVTIAYANLALLHAEAGNAAAAWDCVEEMRAQALRTTLAAHEREISPGMTDEEREAERALAAELTALHVQRDRERGQAKPDVERLKRFGAAITPLTEKRAAFLQQLFSRLPELPVWRGLAPPLTAEHITADVLEDGELAVQFVVDDRELLVLTARRSADTIETATYVVAMKRQALAEHVARALDTIVLADPEPWRKASGEIVKALPPAVLDQVSSAKKVLVIPDDMLWRVPFEALPLGATYVFDRVPLSYAPSISSVVRARAAVASVAKAAPFRVAIVAAPAVPQATVETLKATAPTWVLRAPEAARAEASRVEAAAGAEQATMVVGEAATEEAARGAATAVSVLHVTGPFRVNAASPLFSSLLLALPESSSVPIPATKNGVLEAREVPSAGFATRIAVFADPAALSMRDAASAVPAMQWAWRAGGASGVVVRRWSGDEQGAANLLAAMYESLKTGASAAEALQAAQRAVRKRDPALPPSAWAGWLAIGISR